MSQHTRTRAKPRTSGPSSAARLAAEAAFAPLPATAAARQPPDVLVKPKRASSGGEPQGDDARLPTSQPPARVPKTYRLEAPTLGSAQPVAAEAAGAQAPAGTAAAEPPSSGATPRRRKRSSPPPSKVTVFRPGDGLATSEAAAAGPADTATPAWTPTPRSADLVRRLAELNAEIERLERQALQAKRAEAAEAVRWIKRAIADYGLSAADLGY